MGKWFRRLAYLLRQSRQDKELREEIEGHRALRAAHLEREGMTSQQADTESRRAIGNVLLAREDVRDLWLGSWPAFWQDLRYGLRTLRKNALFTAVAVVTLALGIGINTGIFTVLNGVLFRDLQAPAAHELVSIGQTVEGGQFSATAGMDTFTIAEYHAYRDRAQTLSGVLAHSDPRETTLGGDAPQEVFGAIVSCNYFTVLQQTPSLGRALIEQDCVAGAPPVVVLGHGVWTTTFAADPGIVGRDIELDRRRFTVIGVAADGAAHRCGLPISLRSVQSRCCGPASHASGMRSIAGCTSSADGAMGRDSSRCVPSSESSPRRSIDSSRLAGPR
jgi:hypothetical protein